MVVPFLKLCSSSALQLYAMKRLDIDENEKKREAIFNEVHVL